MANFIFVILSVGSKNPSGFYVDPEYTLLELNILKEKEGDPKVKDFKGSSFFVWITPDGHNE
ncbi:hypothetical protein, partial [Bacteroides salyersiae]|uniref:hypothetical protein n=1 Tax=Bacteroides salyersiae TaxID=291644 RepID=UPI003566CE95